MRREAGGPCLSAVFVDYDNIYLSLKRKSEEAAKRFAKDASVWLRAIETGRLITATNTPFDGGRRIVMNRCYGNPVPRRNAHDNSTDMNSFPFVRHHFLRAGFEVIGEASSGEKTVETVQAMKPDLLLLDISMPRMSGLDALRELQRTVTADDREVGFAALAKRHQLMRGGQKVLR